MKLKVRSRGELISKLKQIKLKNNGKQPYLNARIDLVTLDPTILAPTQRYVLTQELKKIEQVRWNILENHNMIMSHRSEDKDYFSHLEVLAEL